ncbi:MAG: M20/M25/M40 family metallo-hydrolase [Clostridiales bacterium]|nr:M20/M25/M40 family metallo-hydrolase [Clostridiales bacterium]
MNSENINGFKALVRELTEVYGPTGRETKAAALLKKHIAPYVDEIRTDALGNLICVKRGSSGKRIMLSAHMDQIGLIVLDIDEKGFLRFAPVGGIDPEVTVCREVVFENGVRGVTYYEEEKVKDKPKLTQMFIDIGCKTREEAEAHVSIGDICTYAPHFIDMGSRIACGALDDRICCAILVEVMKRIDSPHDVYAVFTSQEEVGLRGGAAAAYSVDPDFGINLDVTASADTPECEKMPMAMGMGPTIKYMDRSAVITKPVIDFMHKVADERGIKVQNEILRYGGTDAGAVQPMRGGKAACCVSIATRYIHSPVELADIGDCLAAIDFVAAMAEEKELPIG